MKQGAAALSSCPRLKTGPETAPQRNRQAVSGNECSNKTRRQAPTQIHKTSLQNCRPKRAGKQTAGSPKVTPYVRLVALTQNFMPARHAANLGGGSRQDKRSQQMVSPFYPASPPKATVFVGYLRASLSMQGFFSPRRSYSAHPRVPGGALLAEDSLGELWTKHELRYDALKGHDVLTWDATLDSTH